MERFNLRTDSQQVHAQRTLPECSNSSLKVKNGLRAEILENNSLLVFFVSNFEVDTGLEYFISLES